MLSARPIRCQKYSRRIDHSTVCCIHHDTAMAEGRAVPGGACGDGWGSGLRRAEVMLGGVGGSEDHGMLTGCRAVAELYLEDRSQLTENTIPQLTGLPETIPRS